MTAGLAYYDPATLKQWITAAIIFVIIMAAAMLLGKWVPPVAMSCYIGAVIAPLMIERIGSEAHEAGHKRAAEAGNSHATTIIEFADGHKKPAPGTRIVCSEHFCGFHDGTTPTVISLEGVRSIHPEPQEQPPHTSDK